MLASRVALLADGIEVEGVAELAGVRYRAVTVHRLHPTKPRLLMTTTFRIESGATSAAVEFGDEVKWGNATCYVEGVAKPRLKFKGHADWMGRRGAGGDLMLRPKSVPRLFVDYAASAKFPGFIGAVSALYQRKGISAGQTVTVSRELAFEPLPVPRPSPPKETGTLALSLRDEADRPIAAKVRLDRDGQTDPVFELDGGLDGADRFLWTGNGKVERALPPGRYALFATAGIERDAWATSVLIRAGQTLSLEARLPRVISTPGWIAADLHLHQAPSVDADISLPARVVAIAAEGVEFAVATDHYVVTDLAPTVRYLKDRAVLLGDLQTLPGSEVSTLGRRFGHFNVFPLAVGKNVKYQDVTPSELFADARKQSPGGVLQVNHPRFDPKLGYFTYHGIDDATGEMKVAGYDPSFDTLEVYNGDDAYDIKRVRKVLLPIGCTCSDVASAMPRRAAVIPTTWRFSDPGLPRTFDPLGHRPRRMPTTCARRETPCSLRSRPATPSSPAGRSWMSASTARSRGDRTGRQDREAPRRGTRGALAFGLFLGSPRRRPSQAGEVAAAQARQRDAGPGPNLRLSRARADLLRGRGPRGPGATQCVP